MHIIICAGQPKEQEPDGPVIPTQHPGSYSSILNILFVLGNLKNRNLMGDEIPTKQPGSYSSILNILVIFVGGFSSVWVDLALW